MPCLEAALKVITAARAFQQSAMKAYPDVLADFLSRHFGMRKTYHVFFRDVFAHLFPVSSSQPRLFFQRVLRLTNYSFFVPPRYLRCIEDRAPPKRKLAKKGPRRGNFVDNL